MRRPLYFALLLAACLACGGLLFGAYSAARQDALNNLAAQETLLAQQAAQAIQEYFSGAKGLALTMGQSPHVLQLDAEGESALASALRENPRELLAISRVDEQGRILFSTPDNSVAGRDLSGQEHVARVLMTRQPTVSDVFTSVQGFRAVALHVPLFRGEEFRGTIALLLDFDAIARRYLDNLRVVGSGHAFVVSRKGVLLYSPVPGFSGRNSDEVVQNYPELKAMVRRMIAGESGRGSYQFDYVRDRYTGTVRKLGVFLPIPIEDTYWSVCVAAPESEIESSIKRFGLYLLPMGLVVLLCTGLGVGLGLRHFVLEKEIVLRRSTEAALRESESRYRSVIENISDVFYRTDREGRLVMISPSVTSFSGYSEEEILGRPSATFWRRPEQRERLQEMLQAQGTVRDFEVELVAKDGRVITVATTSTYYRDKDGNILGVEGIFRDITQGKRDRAKLVESARRFHSLFDNMAEGVALCTLVRDDAGRVVDYRVEEVNRSYERIFDVQAEDMAGKTITAALDLDEPPFLSELSAVALGGEPFSRDFRYKRLDKQLSMSAGPWGEEGFAAIFSDITERKQMEEQLRFRALHDPLTGLANRILCLDRIALASVRAARRPAPAFAVVFMDLDRFKVVNDSLGHDAGDMLLREVAARLLACTRRMDTVCRYGGDEFALVLEELSAREVLRTLKRIRESLKRPVAIGPHQIQVEASFGVAYPPDAPLEAEELLRNANIALHQAKRHGRNRVVVYKPSMHAAAIQVMSLEHDIRRGLEQDEFSLLYQPIFDLRSGRLEGFEALLRWRHPLRGPVSPAEFIPAAEESGSIFELGGLALSRGCREMAELLRAQPGLDGLTLSVNLSPRQFSRQGLAEQVEQALVAAQLPPEALVLEITESSITRHPEAAANILTRLKTKGVLVAIDDFGTGYSSMSALKRLPLDRLKIDRSFVSRLAEGLEDKEIVRAMVTLARALGLKTVAEGIETVDQRDLLRALGCDLGQGFLCARPMPMERVPAFLNETTCRPGEP